MAKRDAQVTAHAARLSMIPLVLGCRPLVSIDAAEPQRTLSVAVAETPVELRPEPAPLPGEVPIGPTEVAEVLRVIDGDTIEIDRGGGRERVRYIGVDAPESADAVERLGPEAAAANAALVEGARVWLEKEAREYDPEGRLLRHVWVSPRGRADGREHVGLSLVRSGLARAARSPWEDRYSTAFSAAETTARASRAGIWGEAEVVAPDSWEVEAAGEAWEEPAAKGAAGRRAGPRRNRATPSTERAEELSVACHSSYTPCLPVVDDLNCPEVAGIVKGPVQVVGHDDYRLDADGDGVGCEDN